MSDESYVFVSNGNDSECDGKEGEYEDGPPDRPHPNCNCKIELKQQSFGCASVQMELDGVSFDPPDSPPVVGGGDDDEDDPNNPKLVIPGLPPGTEIRPPLEWQEAIPCCTYHYHIECENGFTKSGIITVCPPDSGVGLDDYEFWEQIVCPWMLDGSETEAWDEVEAIVAEVLGSGECRCAPPEMSA